MTAGDFCTRRVVTIHRDDTLLEAAQRIRRHHVGMLVVVDEREGQRIPVGVLTDRDLVVGVLADEHRRLEDLLVGDVMTVRPITGHKDEGLLDVLNKMRNAGVRRLPIVNEQGGLEGILTFDDLIELVAGELSGLCSLLLHARRRESDTRP